MSATLTAAVLRLAGIARYWAIFFLEKRKLAPRPPFPEEPPRPIYVSARGLIWERRSRIFRRPTLLVGPRHPDSPYTHRLPLRWRIGPPIC